MSVEAAFRQLQEANPVPEPGALRRQRRGAADFHAEAKRRSTTLQTQQIPRVATRPDESHRHSRRWAAALASGVGLLAVFVIFSGIGDRGLDTVAGEGVLTVDVLTDLDMSPFTDATGDVATGFDIDLLAEMARRSGLTLATSESLSVFSAQPQAHLFLAEFGTVDVTTRGYRADIYRYADAINVSGDRLERQARFTDPYFLQDFALIVDPQASPDVTSTADLTAGDVVAAWGDANASFWIDDNLAPRGIVPGYVFDAGPRRPGSASPQTPLDSVAAGEAVAAIVHSAIASDLLQQHPHLSVVDVIDANVPLGFAVDPDNPALLMALNRALAEMIEDGSYQAIYDTWFDDPSGSVAAGERS